MAAQIPTKRLALSKANAQMVGITAAAAFITVFCLVAANAAWSQNRYQARVTAAEQSAKDQLTANLQAFNTLQNLYRGFDGETTNIIGGSSTGTGSNDGSNSKIILDALPSSYDFPALTSSVEKILNDSGLKVSSISGTDDQLSQQNNTSSPTPTAVAMPFSFSVNQANYSSIAQLITKLQQSIRPIQIDQLTLSGDSNDLTLSVNAQTYYQPAKDVNITQKVVK